MSGKLGYVMVVLPIVMLVSFVFSLWLRTKLHAKLLGDIHSGNFEDFDRRIDSRMVSQVLSPYARNLLMFQSCAAREDRAGMVEQFNRLMNLKLSSSMKASLLMEGFNAFVDVGDARHAKKIFDKMTPELVSEQRKALCKRRLARL